MIFIVNITIFLLIMITLCMNARFSLLQILGDSRGFKGHCSLLKPFSTYDDYIMREWCFLLQFWGDSRIFFFFRFLGILGFFFLFQILGDSRFFFFFRFWGILGFFFFFRFWGILGGLFAVGIIMIAVTYVICRFRSPNSCSKLYYGILGVFVA